MKETLMLSAFKAQYTKCQNVRNQDNQEEIGYSGKFSLRKIITLTQIPNEKTF